MDQNNDPAINLMGMVNNSTLFGLFTACKDSIKIFLNTNSSDCERLSSRIAPPSGGADPIKYLAAHEVGHLISYVIRRFENKELDISTSAIIFENIEEISKHAYDDDIPAELSDMIERHAKASEEGSKKIISEIIELAKKKYAYAGNGFISYLGMRRHDENVAEAVAFSRHGGTSGLEEATLGYLEKTDARMADQAQST